MSVFETWRSYLGSGALPRECTKPGVAMMVTQLDSRPRVVVAHAWVGPRRALAAYLGHLRPALRVDAVAPEELGAALAASPAPVVLCDRPGPDVERRARGWMAIPFDGPRGIVAGVGADARPVPEPEDHGMDDFLAALDDLVAGRWILFLPGQSTGRGVVRRERRLANGRDHPVGHR